MVLLLIFMHWAHFKGMEVVVTNYQYLPTLHDERQLPPEGLGCSRVNDTSLCK